MTTFIDRLRSPIATCLAVFVLAFTATPIAAGIDTQKQPPKCNIPHGHTMLANSQAILYRTVRRFEPSIVYGCAFTHGRPFALGEFPPKSSCGPGVCAVITHETLAGALVAYEYFYVAGESGERQEKFVVVVRDLRNGRVLHRVPTGVPRSQNTSLTIGAGPAVMIAFKADGSVAWTNERRAENGSIEYQVHALDKTGNRLLATGTDIDAHSLALAGSTLYWTQAGQPHSTRLD